MNLIVKEIIEEDFGCEGRPDGYVPMCRFFQKASNSKALRVGEVEK